MHVLIPAPQDSDDLPVWRDALIRWRESTRILMQYDDAIYRDPAFDWIPRTFTLGMLMMRDALFYHDGDYDLSGTLGHGEKEFGGYDALILWQGYPQLGFDDRNQFDHYRQMPGGLARLRKLVDACHGRGIKVYVDYNPWDTGTRREGQSDTDALAELVRALDADAVFLDTMSSAAAGLRERLDAVRPGISLESEVVVPLEHLHTHPSSWAQSIEDVPGVLRNKWFERRHMQHRIRRWQADHTPELHTAWMNGTGMVVWENVFGTAVRWCERDKSILRGMIGVQRRYAELFCGEGWTPLVATAHPKIQASLWQGVQVRLWTLVNHSNEGVSDELLQVPHHEGERYFDLIRGEELDPAISDGTAEVSGAIRPRGVGAILACMETPEDLRAFLMRQREIDARANWDARAPEVAESRVYPTPPSAPHSTDAAASRAGLTEMARIEAQPFEMAVTFKVRECGFYDATGLPPSLRYIYLHKPWTVRRQAELRPFDIDRTPVTNAQFAAFLAQSGYVPACADNFLAHWKDGRVPEGSGSHPVVWVDLEDARAYAAWAGKRLPSEEEWQYAAQGQAGRKYPWGEEWRPDACNHGQTGGTTAVDQFSEGRTPEGVYDLCGNVWEWTESERSDGRTRFAILKGGSYFKAGGSEWYADGGAQANDFAAKYLLMSAGIDRCATIGFRCAR